MLKAQDTERQRVAKIFDLWWGSQVSDPVKVAELHDDLKAVIEPQNRGRQFQASAVRKLADTRVAGYFADTGSRRWTVERSHIPSRENRRHGEKPLKETRREND